MTGTKVRVFVVDDHPVVRDGLRQLIGREADLEVCGEAGDVREGLRGIAAALPDIILTDLSLKDLSGFRLIEEARQSFPRMAVLVLSIHDEHAYVERALAAGASGYVIKDEATNVVLQAIRAIMAGRQYLSPIIGESFAPAAGTRPGKPSTSPLESLSTREHEVLELLGRGLGTRRIARRLHLSLKTVEAHCSNMKAKLHLEHMPELATFAARLLGPESRE